MSPGWGQDDVPRTVPLVGVECPPQEQNRGCRMGPFPSPKRSCFGVNSQVLHILMLGVSKPEMGKDFCVSRSLRAPSWLFPRGLVSPGNFPSLGKGEGGTAGLGVCRGVLPLAEN